jgi:coenzyme F420-reducing hydrogenase alpha subunit
MANSETYNQELARAIEMCTAVYDALEVYNDRGIGDRIRRKHDEDVADARCACESASQALAILKEILEGEKKELGTPLEELSTSDLEEELAKRKKNNKAPKSSKRSRRLNYDTGDV